MQRKFYEVLKNWKSNDCKIPLMVVGARQIGKTYIIDEFCKNEFDDYIYINFMKQPNIVKIFEEDTEFEVKVRKFELEINKKINPENTVIFFDEIQESEKTITSLKFFCESELPYKIICAGSLLGVKLHRFHSSFPVGKVQIKFMYPMDFEEFLWALDKKMWADEIRRCYNNLEEISIHDKLMELYRTYLCIGGMPEAIKEYKKVNEEILLWNQNSVKDIILSYIADMTRYTTSSIETIKIEKVYKTIPTILAKENKKFKYVEIEKKASKREYESAIDWLVSSNLVYQCTLVNKIEAPLKAFEQLDYFKLYVNDVGILTSLLEIKFSDILLNNNFMLKGAIAENYVAQAFATNGITLNYWKSKNNAEIDFLLYNDDGIIPVEVKADENTKAKSFNLYMEKYKPKYGIRISAKNFGFNNNIKSIPLYAVFCI